MISKVTTLWVLNIQLPQNNKGTKKKKKTGKDGSFKGKEQETSLRKASYRTY